MSDKELVDIKALAGRLQVSVNSIRNWVKSGRIPPATYIQINQTRRFYVSDVEAALRADRPETQLALPLAEPAPRRQPFIIDNDEE